ncbi:hypothetical protein FAM09_20915 [Niastella caeni]|uniref:DUF3108 domain-containing protein n=1 Tax=Niastella caeni TaxID=2569763 RepID=A0A4S8HKQ6_9BACT|nr:hypothetical protein [Niastella caeni]THU35858.1 hypothetical protein FAM09_20915 [Niastella caeni]
MKSQLFLLFSLFCVNAFSQTCTNHVLFQKDAKLEYNVYMPDLDVIRGMSSTDLKVSRLVYEVDHVTDSAGSVYSTIIKRGFSIHDENDHFERRIVLQCDSRNLLFPFDFYTADTIYTRDVYPKDRRDKHSYVFAYTPMEDAIAFIVPLVMDGINKLPEGKKQLEQKVKHRYRSETSGLVKRDIDNKINIKSIKLIGKESVKTEAGTFVCYKLYVDSDQKVNKFSMPVKFWLYLNSELGLVKMEGPGGNIELVSIKK